MNSQSICARRCNASTPSMPQSSSKPLSSLKTEVSKLARLSNVQNGLPFILRGAPVIAILAGDAIAKATNGRNAIEERILGPEKAIELDPPRRQTRETVMLTYQWGSRGAEMMCVRCRDGDALSGYQSLRSLSVHGPRYTLNSPSHRWLVSLNLNDR